MANVFAIHSVGNSIVSFLRNAYPADLRAQFPCAFRLFSSGELADVGDIGPTLSLHLYRLTINEHLRNVNRFHLPDDGGKPLSLNLHFLLTVWADSAPAEQAIFAWALRQLYLNPIFNISSLSAEAGWEQDDFIQLLPEELTNEDIMRIWDAVEPSYRLSFSYVARTVRIDPDTTPDHLPVVATRFDYAGPTSTGENGS